MNSMMDLELCASKVSAYAGMSAVRAQHSSLLYPHVHIKTLYEAGGTGVLTRDDCEPSITKDRDVMWCAGRWENWED